MKESSRFPITEVLSATPRHEEGSSPALAPAPAPVAASASVSGSVTASASVSASVAAPASALSPSVLESRLLGEAGFRHAFFTRLGGVSQLPWDTLSFSIAVGDSPEAVAENVARSAKLLGIPADKLYYLSQVHGSAFRILDGTEDRDEVIRAVGDITLSQTPGVGCGIRTADCVPILLADRRSGAVAAVHSGWRGTADRVALTATAALRDLAGGSVDLIAAIGPHIERCCFEVGEDVAAQLASASSLGASSIHRPSPPNGEPAEGSIKPRVDLRGIVRAQLEEAGVAPGAIDDVHGCTVCDRPRFHSFRRDGARSGRMLSAIVARRL